MTGEDFRELALSLPGALEQAHMGHPDFRVKGKIFASLSANEKTGVVKLTPEEQREFRRMQARVFAPASGAWGRQGWTTIQLDGADTAAVRGALALAWQSVVARPPARRSAKPAVRRSVKGR